MNLILEIIEGILAFLGLFFIIIMIRSYFNPHTFASVSLGEKKKQGAGK